MIRTQKLNEGEIIPLTFDYMFTSIFNKEENIDILEEFVSFYLGIELDEVKGNLKLLSRELELESKEQAGRTVDLLLDYRGKKINIELSNYMSKGVIERNIVYACSVHARQLKYGDIHYKEIEQTIQINLLSYRRNKEEVRERYSLKNERGDDLSDLLIIDVIDMELGKALWYNEPTNKMYSWCKLFMSNNEAELEESRKYIMGRASGEKLDKEVKKLSQEDEMVYLYTKLSREELESNTYIEEAKEMGLQMGYEEGMEKGIEQGIQQGIKQGIQQGIQQGAYEKQKEIVIKLLNKKMDTKEISEITELTIEEIEKIKNEL